jgi:hypothetical protein
MNEARRYALFGGDDYYPGGGWHDFLRAEATAEAAMWREGDKCADWWHVIDLWTGECVARSHPNHEWDAGRLEP